MASDKTTSATNKKNWLRIKVTAICTDGQQIWVHTKTAVGILSGPL